MNLYGKLIEDLIYLKDKLKDDGYSWRDYDCINEACNALEKLGKVDINIPPVTTPNTSGFDATYIPNCCKHCSNHPSNGGSGICNCTAPLFDPSNPYKVTC